MPTPQAATAVPRSLARNEVSWRSGFQGFGLRPAWISLNSTGPTPTRTPTPILEMRLSCNFVNVFVYSTRLHVYTRASLTDILATILARDVRVGVRVSPMEFQLYQL